MALGVATLVAFADSEPGSPWHVVGVVVAAAFVTAFPLVLGSGRSRAAYVLDGAVFVMAVLLLPAPDALLAITLPTIVFEVLAARRTLDRLLYFVAGTTLTNLVAIVLFHGAADLTDRRLLLVPFAVVCAFAGLGLYHAGMVVLLRLRGSPSPQGREAVRFLFPAAGLYAGSGFVGAAIALIGDRGNMAFLLALGVAMAFHLLYWEYRNMVLARTRTDRLFRLATEVAGLGTVAAVERRATTVAADLLQCEGVEIHDDPPDPPHVTAAMNVRGRVRWLVPTSTLVNVRSLADEERRALQAVARVTAGAMERLELEGELRAESRRDPLTGTLNRAAFDGELRAAIARARRDRRSFAIAYGDLDGFKPINDEHGHQVGDEVLRHVAERLQDEIRAGDVVARIGGDEFVLLLHPPAGELDVEAAITRAATAVRRPMRVDGLDLTVDISLGSATWPEDGDTPQELIRAADQRMYDVKRRRR